jgi:hypothetical protein
MRALEDFDPARGLWLETYAAAWIKAQAQQDRAIETAIIQTPRRGVVTRALHDDSQQVALTATERQQFDVMRASYVVIDAPADNGDGAGLRLPDPGDTESALRNIQERPSPSRWSVTRWKSSASANSTSSRGGI